MAALGRGRLAGVATAAEYAQVGISKAAIRGLIERGLLVPVSRGVYARSSAVAEVAARPNGERMLRLAAALAVLGPGAVGSYEDAVLAHGLALLDRPPADVLVCRSDKAAIRSSRRAGVRERITWLPRDQVVIAGRLPVTSVPRTVVDVARTVPFRAGVVVADSALRLGKTTKAELKAVAKHCARWPGIERARAVIDFADGKSESALESISRVAFRDGGLPVPRLQAWLGGPGEITGRTDFYWPQYRTVAEADGAIKYADPEKAKLQLRRDADLRAAGFEVVHFTWQDITATPDVVVAAIRAAFRRSSLLRAVASQEQQVRSARGRLTGRTAARRA